LWPGSGFCNHRAIRPNGTTLNFEGCDNTLHGAGIHSANRG
jgi:hypothetical protein